MRSIVSVIKKALKIFIIFHVNLYFFEVNVYPSPNKGKTVVAILFWVWCYHCVFLNSWKKHHGRTRGTKGYADTGFKNQILKSESVSN